MEWWSDGAWRVGLRLRFQPAGLTGRRVDPPARREQWCDEKKQKPRIPEIKRLDSQAYKLKNGVLKLVESLERKRDRGGWIDHLVVRESNAAYGDE
jgi:hypothetical protein